MSAPRHPIIGAILAGGASSRFGSPKALAMVDGARIIDRVRSAMEAAVDETVLIANEPELFAHLHLPTAGDRAPGLGPLAGVDAALRWATARGASGALCVSCDLPFAPAGLLREIAARAEAGRAVVPEGARGIEPLCARYPVSALGEIERLLASDDRSMRTLLAAVGTERIPADVARRFGDPEVLFFNVNTRDDLERAEGIARRTHASS